MQVGASSAFNWTSNDDFSIELWIQTEGDTTPGSTMVAADEIAPAAWSGGTRGMFHPSTTAFTPGAALTLQLRVSAAPWVPVEEVRVGNIVSFFILFLSLSALLFKWNK